ncbi:MAG: alpha/beta hydrolase [Alteromonadaceae bacterium]|uniref:alpha/beta fold hydrolase n=1 Tax=unclassified Marinobacter TaxID=83889 RepID=UPI000C3FCF7A|nr:alpha/beta hydrolase [Marinobacter sp. BGYM27]MAA67034.1 alpha/beta hydrolase [Alteromonadaceae bacterium]MBH85114.1 alpha/beta hydrolase [Alteromonadaceae bacterium]MDG5500091.1 alpha/beta hydrolase [Marinobacter sp. BGYM27]
MPADSPVVSGLQRTLSRIPDPWPMARTGHRWLQRMRRHSAVIDNHRVVWLESGKRKPNRPSLVLLHGLASMKENWGAWLPLLPRDWHVVAVDLPGFGESDYRVGASYRYRDQADRMLQWLGAAGLGEVHLVGSSMGGAIATLMADKGGERVVSLTVMNSAGIPANDKVDLERPPVFDRSVLIPESWSGVFRMFNQVGNGKVTAMGVAMTGLLGGDLLKRAGQHRHVFSDMAADPYAPAQALPERTGPTLVIWGDRDRITPTGCVDFYRQHMRHAEIHVMRGVGHLPMVENPKRSVALLIDFLARQGR